VSTVKRVSVSDSVITHIRVVVQGLGLVGVLLPAACFVLAAVCYVVAAQLIQALWRIAGGRMCPSYAR
jgi:hypothetical protein